MIEWTNDDRKRARHEGWFITWTRLLIGKCSDVDGILFHSDNEARAYVEMRADTGSEFHIRALAYIAQEIMRRVD